MTQDGNTQPTTVYTLFVGEGTTKEDEVSGGSKVPGSQSM